MRTPHAGRGVLEHPEGSTLWRDLGLPAPIGVGQIPLLPGPFTIEVDQVHWGHPAAKRTWLFIVGLDPRDLPALPPPTGRPTHVITTNRAWTGLKSRPPVLAARQRHLTPPAFADFLVNIARQCAAPGP